MSGLEEMQYRLAVSMAGGDGAFSSSEKALLGFLAQALELDPAEVTRLEKQASQINYDMLKRVYQKREERLKLLETALLMAMADGQAEPEEWKMSVKLARALHLDREDSKECMDHARKKLISFIKKHGMIEELRENLKKWGAID